METIMRTSVVILVLMGLYSTMAFAGSPWVVLMLLSDDVTPMSFEEALQWWLRSPTPPADGALDPIRFAKWALDSSSVRWREVLTQSGDPLEPSMVMDALFLYHLISDYVDRTEELDFIWYWITPSSERSGGEFRYMSRESLQAIRCVGILEFLRTGNADYVLRRLPEGHQGNPNAAAPVRLESFVWNGWVRAIQGLRISLDGILEQIPADMYESTLVRYTRSALDIR